MTHSSPPKSIDYGRGILLSFNEKTRCGEALLLFATKEAAEEYIEKHDLAVWIGSFSVSDAEKLSLSQLRQIGNIITDPEQTKP